jgi:L-arabinonolactonase
MARLELIVDCRNTLGEGLVWDAQHQLLYWTDIEGRRLWTLAARSGRVTSLEVPERIACLAPRASGGLVVAFASGFAFYDLRTGEREDIAPFEPELAHTRLNDGRTDRQGRLVAGGFDEVEGKAISSVVRLDRDLRVTTLFKQVGCANGTCFSPDGRTMYFADTPTREICAIDYDPSSGALGARHRLAGFEGQPGMPDGSCVDEEGFIWNAQWNGRRVVRYAPDGRVDRIIEVPVLNPTCVTFGASDLDTLYITTARYLMTAEQIAAEPLSGALFACKPGVRGVPDAPFAG